MGISWNSIDTCVPLRSVVSISSNSTIPQHLPHYFISLNVAIFFTCCVIDKTSRNHKFWGPLQTITVMSGEDIYLHIAILYRGPFLDSIFFFWMIELHIQKKLCIDQRLCVTRTGGDFWYCSLGKEGRMSKIHI